MAAARLRELVDDGLLEREDYREPGQRTRQRYRLTEKGEDLLPVLVALMQWGDRWLDERGGPVELRHSDCGEPVRAQLRCAAGHPVTPDELSLARAARDAGPAGRRRRRGVGASGRRDPRRAGSRALRVAHEEPGTPLERGSGEALDFVGIGRGRESR